jgi:hypothetical protein
MKDGISVVVHINTLRRAYGLGLEVVTSTPTPLTRRVNKPRLPKQPIVAPERILRSDAGKSSEVRTKPPGVSNPEGECEEDEVNTPSSVRSGQRDPEEELHFTHSSRELRASNYPPISYAQGQCMSQK